MEIINPELKQNDRGYYEIRWTEKVDGGYRSRTASTRTKDKSAAQIALAEFVKAEKQAQIVSKTPLVSDIMRAYLSALVADKKSATQLRCARRIETCLGKYRISELTNEVIIDYRRSRGVEDGALRRELGALIAALNYAAEEKLLDPRDVPKIKRPRDSEPREVFLEDEEEAEFYALAMGHSIGKKRLTRLTRFVALGLDTATRSSAAKALTWNRVKLRAGTIDFRIPGGQLHNKRRGIVGISKRLAPLLERAYEERVSDYVLDHPGEIKSEYRKWVRSTPYPHITPHDMRRTWATLAAMHGVPLIDVAAVLQDSVETVIKHYAKYVPGGAMAAVNKRWG